MHSGDFPGFQIEMSRLYSPYDAVTVGTGTSNTEVFGNKIYRGRAKEFSELQDEATCRMEDNEVVEEHG